MKPETVLNLKSGDKPERIRDEWLKGYKAYAEEFLNIEDLAALLSTRVNRACELILERSAPETFTAHDEMYYEMESRHMDSENNELDGDFPLGNEEDALFAGTYFTIPDLVSIQLGYQNLVDCGYYTEYNYAVLARKGFIAELNSEWVEAARCYQGISGSKTVQDREYMCRRKAKEEGEKQYSQAQQYMENGEWSEVYPPLQAAVDMGNTDAMTDLGLARIYGQFGCAKDIDEALKLLRTAANDGNARAAFEICDLYDSGINIDAKEAMEMCEKAAKLGHKKAQERLNDGFDLRPVKEILEEQVEQGNADAMWRLFLICQDEEDTKNADRWLNMALEAGQVDALVSVADSYADKDSETHSEELAERYYRRAADAGNVKAILTLGDRELKDTDISFSDMAVQLKCDDTNKILPEQNIVAQHKKQFAWYELAAQSGDEVATYSICNAYILGYPIDRDYEKAFLWASRGTDNGSEVCMYMAAYLYENGFGVEKDIDAAIMFYTQAAEKGVRSAMIRLYQIYSKGFEHIPADPQKTAHYLFLCGEGRD